MTPTEWGKLQGFIGYAFVDEHGQDLFSFPDGTTRAQQYKQFGNSVTIPVIEEMARFMLKCFDRMTDCQIESIVKMASENEYITRRDVVEKLHISSNRANYLLRKARQSGDIDLDVNRGRYARYIICK